MRIDCHTHVFNLLTAATPYALKVFLAREKRGGFPEWLNALLAKGLERLAKQVGGLTREDIARDLLRELLADERVKAVLPDLPYAKLGLASGKLTETILGRLTEDALDRILKWLGRRLKKDDPERDVSKSELSDWVDFAATAFKPRIAGVCEDLFENLGATDGVVALMMDITEDASHERVFVEQMEQTAKMILRYPGRFFPFVAVNPLRKAGADCRFEKLLRRATRDLGFVGVKLYASLGYKLDCPEMRRVYDYCLEQDLPITLHCNKGGFTPANQTFWKNADPERWANLLVTEPRYRAIRICFGHFGGDEAMAADHPVKADAWTAKIVELMKAPGSNVYADVSYHTAAMSGGPGSSAEANYFGNLKDLLADDAVRERVLFGTDHWMVRVRCAPKSYWNYFRTKLRKYLGDADGAAAWDRMTQANPARFLGLPLHGCVTPAAPIRRYARFVGDHAAKVGEIPAAWLKLLVEEQLMRSVTFITGFALGSLCMDRPVDRAIYTYFRKSGKFGMSDPLDPDHASDLPLRELRYYKYKGAQRSLAMKKVASDLHAAICQALQIAGPARGAKAGVLGKITAALGDGDMLLRDFARNMTLMYGQGVPT
jgi:predicted TIM-barrel fold metal-dependent hydrolase